MSISQYIGIDVSLDYLDMGFYPSGQTMRFANSVAGIADLAKVLDSTKVEKVVLEATGGLEYAAALHLKKQGFKVSVVNPARTAAFRTMRGGLTKTDALDAKLLAEFAKRLEPIEGGVLDENQKKLKELVVRRRQLVDLVVQETNRLKTSYDPEIKRSMQTIISILKQEREQIETQLLAAIHEIPELRERFTLLKTIPAIGPVVAATLITEMPELGRLSRKQASALAGIAPHNRDSGKTKGMAVVRGGRRTVRGAIYMAAVVAMRRNPPRRALYLKLVEKGKPKKVALTAVMRKLVVIANQILKTKQPWQNNFLLSA